MKNTLLPLLLLLILLPACKKEKKQAKKDKKIIEQYIQDHQLSASSTASGLYYVIHQPGTGTQPGSSSQVKVAYKGYLTDGSVFDQNTGGATLSLSRVIEGWREGLQLFREGGTGILLIPSGMAYGPDSRTGIPANSVLIFDVHLIDVL